MPVEPMLSLALIAISILFLLYFFAHNGKHKAEVALTETERELKRAKEYAALLEDKLEMKSAELTIKASNYESLRKTVTTMQKELDFRSESEQTLHNKVNILQHQLESLNKQYDDLYSTWSECQLVGVEQHAVIGEAMVYVGISGIYHTRIHGSWRDYKMMPLREALARRFCIPPDRRSR